MKGVYVLGVFRGGCPLVMVGGSRRVQRLGEEEVEVEAQSVRYRPWGRLEVQRVHVVCIYNSPRIKSSSTLQDKLFKLEIKQTQASKSKRTKRTSCNGQPN